MNYFFKFNLIYFFIEQALISYLFYTYYNVCMPIPISPFIPPPPCRNPLSPISVHTFVLYIGVSISALKTGSSVPFF